MSEPPQLQMQFILCDTEEERTEAPSKAGLSRRNSSEVQTETTGDCKTARLKKQNQNFSEVTGLAFN